MKEGKVRHVPFGRYALVVKMSRNKARMIPLVRSTLPDFGSVRGKVSRALNRSSKQKIYKSLIRPTVTYRCGAWTLTN